MCAVVLAVELYEELGLPCLKSLLLGSQAEFLVLLAYSEVQYVVDCCDAYANGGCDLGYGLY